MSNVHKEISKYTDLDIFSSEINKNGYYKRRFLNKNEFYNFCNSVGEIIALDSIRSMQSDDTDDSELSDVPFHTDGPMTDLIGWFCVRQDNDAGHSLLIDTIDCLRFLSPTELDQLRSINIPCYDERFIETGTRHRAVLLGNCEENWQINYTPWHLPEINEKQNAAFLALQQSISSKLPISIRLLHNEALFVDNWRVLHGRGPLYNDSKRHLERAWLRTNRKYRNDPIS